MNRDICSAITPEKSTDAVVNALASQLGDVDARAILFFCSHQHDGAAISGQLRKRYPKAEVIGCTTAGELTNTSSLTGAVSALALGPGKVKRAAGALAKFGSSVDGGVKAAVRSMNDALKADVRELDASKHVGI